MKKILYSGYTKAAASILFVASIILCVLTVTCGVTGYFKEKATVYNFENDFSDAHVFEYLLEAPESAVFNACTDFHQSRNGAATADEKNIYYYVEKRLDSLHSLDKINYYIEFNGKIYTNCGAENEKGLMSEQFYKYTVRDESGNTETQSTQQNSSYSILAELYEIDKTSTITVCTSIKESYVTEFKEIWERQEKIVLDTFTLALIYAVVALLLLVYLLCVCGKNKNGELRAVWIDNAWAEIHIAAVSAITICGIFVCAIILDNYSTGHFPQKLTYMIVGAVSGVIGFAVLASFTSIARNIKCGRFLSTSIIARSLRLIWKTSVKIINWFAKKVSFFKNTMAASLSRKTGAVLISMLFGYTALIALCAVLTFVSFPIWIIIGFLLFGIACFVVSYRGIDIDEIRNGAREIKNGNLSYKIPDLRSEDMRALASDVNDIGMGLENSVSAKLRAERLKTELITNVSHDLKTPLTSIISYAELLSQVEDLPEEARNYIGVILKKSERLKNLTQDLFDISKAQSGNEEVSFEKLDAALLINQSLGEHDGEIKKSGIPFCVSVAQNAYIRADGKKMSRVLGNLIENILKYTLSGTRVFITVKEDEGNVITELKNIASYPMEFDAEEITGRFVRGDKSRTEPGSGLGLAIAKSYTELCNGKFEIKTDGDMFKVIITFKNYM